MTNPLITLDELIWKQFEKVTIAADKRLGWDKWDLARITYNLADAAYAGFGTYLAVAGIENSSPALFFFGGSLVIGSYYVHKLHQANNKRQKSLELQQLITTGAPAQPSFGPKRPLELGFYLFAEYHSLTLAYNNKETFISLSAGDESAIYSLFGLAIIFGGVGATLWTFGEYFSSQLPRPPSAKKTLWRALAEYVTKPFHKDIALPAEQPAAKYSLIPESHQS